MPHRILTPEVAAQLLRTVFELSLDALVLTDRDGRPRLLNKAAEKFLGHSEDELIDRLLGEVLAEPLNTQLAELRQRAVRTGEAVHADLVLQGTSGPRTWQVTITPSLAESEPVGSLLINARDFSERARAQIERQRFFEIIDELVCITDFSGKVRYANNGWHHILGYTPEEVVNLQPMQWVVPEDVEPTTEVMARLFTGEPVKGYENRVMTRTGEMRWIMWNCVSFLEDGLIYAIGVDITARKREEQRVAADEAHYRAIVQDQTELICRYRRDSTLTFVNEAFCRYSNRPKQELIGHRFADNMRPEDRAVWEQSIAALTPENPVTIYEHQVKLPDGELRWQQWTDRLIAVENGIPLEYQGVGRDVTQAKIAEERLREATRAAEEATRVKSQFLANMSHEIRTPLNGVVGMADLLASTTLDDEQGDYLRTLRRSGDALLNVINEVLDFSKIEAGQLELEQAPFDLHAIMEQVPEMFVRGTQEKKLKLRVMIDEEVPRWVSGDAARLRQVLLNLTNNAIKFTDRGEIKMCVSLVSDANNQAAHDPAPHNQAALRFSVVDTGIGIPQDRFDRLFKPFSQVDASTTRKYGGTGLGLVICQQIVERMHGRIGVDSTVGVGSNFWFEVTLPIAESGNEPTPAEEFRALRDAASERKEAGRRILLVEDNAVNQIVARRMLEKMGHLVEISPNGRLAVDRLAADRFDLVLMDCQMPEMDGYEATRAIRQREGDGHRTPIIALTAEALQGDRERCLEAGMDDYLSKPLEMKALHAMISTYLGRNASNATRAASRPAVSWSSLLDHAMGDEIFAALILGDLMAMVPTQCETMRAHLKNGDLGAVARLAHQLKSATESVGAESMRSVCIALEISALNGDAESVASHLDRMHGETRRIAAELHNRRGLSQRRGG